MVFLSLWRVFLNLFLMAFLVHLFWSDQSCHILGRNLFGRAINMWKGSLGKGKEKGNKKQGKEQESRGSGGRVGSVSPCWPHRCAGRARLVPGLVLSCSRRSTSHLPPLPPPDQHDVRFLHSWEPGQRVMSTGGACLPNLMLCSSASPLSGPFHCHPSSPSLSLSFSSSYATLYFITAFFLFLPLPHHLPLLHLQLLVIQVFFSNTSNPPHFWCFPSLLCHVFLKRKPFTWGSVLFLVFLGHKNCSPWRPQGSTTI